jgi:chromosome partitioning protein
METWVIANQKGGVGKTTTTITMGALLASRGKRVLLVDLDPHGSLTAYLGYDPDTVEGSIYEIFQSGRPIAEYCHESRIDNLWLVPASPALATLDRQLGTRQGGGVVLKKGLEQLKDKIDYVLVDCPPTLGILMINALAAADFLIVPVQTEFLALKGLERMERTLTMIRRARKSPIPYLIVPTLYDKRTRASRESLNMLRENYAENLWDLIIPVDTQFRDASKKGLPLSAMNDQARGVLAFTTLLDTVLEMRTDTYQRNIPDIAEVETYG